MPQSDDRVLPELRAVLGAAPEADLSLPVAELRTIADAGVSTIGAAIHTPAVSPEVTDHLVKVTGGQIGVRVYRPASAPMSGAPAHVHLHGGGWWMGSLETAHANCLDLAAESGWVIVSVGYRLAPEHPFPTPLEDVLTAIEWVADQGSQLGIDVATVTIGGESAGANLAAAACLALRDRGGVRVAAQWLDVPAVDLTLRTGGRSLLEFGTGYGIDRAGIETCIDYYARPSQRLDPLVSPIAGDLAALPAAVISVAECDPLRDQGVEYAERLTRADVPVELRCWPGHLHSTMWLTALSPTARDCQRWAIDAMDQLRAAVRTSVA